MGDPLQVLGNPKKVHRVLIGSWELCGVGRVMLMKMRDLYRIMGVPIRFGGSHVAFLVPIGFGELYGVRGSHRIEEVPIGFGDPLRIEGSL